MAKPSSSPSPDTSSDAGADLPDPAAAGGVNKKVIAGIVIVTLLVWAFAINTGSTVLIIIVAVLTAVLLGVLGWAFFMLRKQRGLASLLQGATGSDDARREALAKLNDSKDAKTPLKVFARAQLMAQDDPKAAITLLETVDLKTFPAGMQDDVALLRTQLYLGSGRTADARKVADSMNLDNPSRKAQRPLSAAICAEAWARTGKHKDALVLLDSIELSSKDKDAEAIALQASVARVFARFANNQRPVARAELLALANLDLNNLGRFLMPQFRVHPELQQLARQVLEQHPSRKKMQARRR